MDAGYGYSPNGVGDIMKLDVIGEGCEIITELYNFKKEKISPVMTRFKNSLGGKVVVMANTLGCEYTIINYRRQRLIHNLMLWCSDNVAFVREAPSVCVIMNEAIDTAKSGFKGMLTLVNLCEDSLDEIRVHLPIKWSKTEEICALGTDGKWTCINYEKCGCEIIIKGNLGFLDPMYLLVK